MSGLTKSKNAKEMEKIHKKIYEAGRQAALLDMDMPEDKFHSMIASHHKDSLQSNVIRSGYNKGGNGVFDKIGNEITNPRSDLRGTYIPTAGYISNYTYFVDPTPISTVINATDKVNNVVTALQTGERIPEAIANAAASATYNLARLPLPTKQKAAVAAAYAAAKTAARYTKKGKGKVKKGLYANIQAKRKRIKKEKALGLPVEKMRKPGSKGAPTQEAFKKSALTAKPKKGGFSRRIVSPADAFQENLIRERGR
jgi:hypothetical protein